MQTQWHQNSAILPESPPLKICVYTRTDSNIKWKLLNNTCLFEWETDTQRVDSIKKKLQINPKKPNLRYPLRELTSVCISTSSKELQNIFLDFRWKITEKHLEWTQKVENGQKSTRKLVKIHNIGCFNENKIILEKQDQLWSVPVLMLEVDWCQNWLIPILWTDIKTGQISALL